MTRFMEDTITDQEIEDLHTEQRIAEYLATDPDHMFTGYRMATFATVDTFGKAA